MGVSFDFYGNTFSRVFLSMNRIVSFDSLTTYYSANSYITSTTGQGNMIVWLWDDLDCETGTAYLGTVDYDGDLDLEFIVQFDNWYYDLTSLSATIQAQVILDSTDNNIMIQYNQHGPDISVSEPMGIENGDESIGLEYNL